MSEIEGDIVKLQDVRTCVMKFALLQHTPHYSNDFIITDLLVSFLNMLLSKYIITLKYNIYTYYI